MSPSVNRRTAWTLSSLEPRMMLAADAGVATSIPAEIGRCDIGHCDIGHGETGQRVVDRSVQNIVFVDPSVPNMETMLNGIDVDHEIVLLDPQKSGVDQISSVLKGRSQVSSVHLITHGDSGKIVAGNQTVDEAALVDAQDQIKRWSRALTADADILLYGCETGSGRMGEQFVRRLASLTGADVAASIDKTGATILGGDWDLEQTVGVIDSAIAINPTIRDRYFGVLPITINAAGQTGDEILELHIDGVVAATFSNVGGDPDAGVFQSFTFAADGISADQISLHFTNDLMDAASNIDRNVRIDNIVVDGVTFEAEDLSVFSTGTWLESDGTTAGFGRGEWLHSDGYMQFASDPDPIGSTITVRASGQTGEETFALLIDETVVASFDAAQSQQDFVFESDQTITGSQIRIAFTNDLYDGDNGIDRNLFVDFVKIDDVVLQTEDSGVFSTGTWTAENADIVEGFWESETLHGEGYFQFADADTEPELPGVGSVITIRAAGDTGAENLRLQINGVTVKNWSSIGTAMQDFTYQADGAVTIDQLRVVFANDLFDAATGVDRNLYVDNVTLDSIVYETESPLVYSTGTWLAADGVTPGFRLSETLHSEGYFQFASDPNAPNVGAIALADNFFSANETDGTIEIEFVRSVGFDGIITVDYTLFDDTATGGEDYVAGSGTVSIADGETSSTLIVNLLDDDLDEGAETFTIAIENQTPGALLLAPRTATIEIIDDENPTGGNSGGGDPVPDIDLQATVLVDGLVGTTAIDFSTDGSIMYLANTEGKIYVYTDGYLQADLFLDFTDRVNAPRGLLDIAVHPDFENNGYIYLAYAYDPPETANHIGLAGVDGLGNRASRVTRVTADATNGYLTVVPDSEVVILGANSTWDNFNGFVDSTVDFEEPPAGILADGSNLQDFLAADSQSHTVDSLEFGPDGMLYVSNGDGSSYNQADPRTVRVQDIDNLSGKLLRIDPLTGEGAADNPFYEVNDPSSNRSKVYQYGFRNPFRIVVDAVSGQTYVGDVGWSDWEEINAGGPGDNFGWPFYEGGDGVAIPTLYYQDLPEAQAFYASGIETVTGMIGLNHVTDGIDAITLGDINYGTDFGEAYQGSLIYAQLGAGVVNAVIFDDAGEVDEIKTIATGYQFLVHMVSGPDGHMYFVDFDDGTIGYWTLAEEVVAEEVEEVVGEEVAEVGEEELLG